MRIPRITTALASLALLAALSTLPRAAIALPSSTAAHTVADTANKSEARHADIPKAVDGKLSGEDWQSIRAAWQAGRHAITESTDHPGTWQARNPGQQWTTHFDARGFDTQPDGAAWRWGLELRRWGMAGSERSITGNSIVSHDGQRASYGWGNGLEEWFVNDTLGLEHCYTVHSKPAGQGDQLRFELAVRGGLKAQIDAHGRGVRFVDATGAAALNYNGLIVWDADGKVLNATFQPIEHGLALAVNTRDARYPITIDPIAQQAYLKASNTDAEDSFGRKVAVSGDTVVVGAHSEDSNASGVNGDQTNNLASGAGAVYVFVRTAGAWSQQAYLKASNTDVQDYFGTSVAISGDTVVVGAYFEDSFATGVNGIQTNNATTNAGAAYVFVRSGSSWSQQAYLKASNTGFQDTFGYSVAISDDTIVVGATGEDSSSFGVNQASNNLAESSGAAYVFVRTAGSWSQQAYLKASNTDSYDQFGDVVAVSGDTVVVGAYSESSNASGINGDQTNNAASWAGAVYVFVRTAGTWNQQAYLKASNTEADDQFGRSVGVSGNTIVVGAIGEGSDAIGVDGSQNNNRTSEAGAAYVFVRTDDNWNQQAYLKASNTDSNDHFGRSVSVSGDMVVIGASAEDSIASGIDGDQADNASTDAGAAYLFARDGDIWHQQSYLKASNSSIFTYFGFSVAISEATVVVGAYGERSNATGINGDQSNSSVIAAGAAYVFETPVFYAVGGFASGLAGDGLVLRNNDGDDLAVEADGNFTFSTFAQTGSAYAVSVLTQPSNPSQTCTVTNGSGTVTSGNVTNVAVTCVTNTYTVGGIVSGLSGSGLVLRNNNGDDLSVAADGAFAFTTPVASGDDYAVTVFTQPSTLSQTCTVSNGGGTVTSANISNIQVFCVTNTYTMGGSVAGLSGGGLTLLLNGGDALPVNGSTFTFTSSLPSGANYIVTISQQPSDPLQACSLTNSSGTVTSANITNVVVNCIDAMPQLSLSVDDARLFSHYGQINDYLVTLSNTGNATAANIGIGSTLSAGLDLGNAHWQCFGAGSGATCLANGSGPLIDTVTLPPDRGLTWLVSVPVLTDTTDNSVQLDISAPGATSVSDVDTLVIFRTAFDVASGDGSLSEPLPLEDASNGFRLTATSGNRIEDVRTFRSGKTSIHVQRIRLDSTDYVRLLERADLGAESASGWAPTTADALLVISSVVDADGNRIALLEGALQSLTLQFAATGPR